MNELKQKSLNRIKKILNVNFEHNTEQNFFIWFFNALQAEVFKCFLGEKSSEYLEAELKLLAVIATEYKTAHGILEAFGESNCVIK